MRFNDRILWFLIAIFVLGFAAQIARAGTVHRVEAELQAIGQYRLEAWGSSLRRVGFSVDGRPIGTVDADRPPFVMVWRAPGNGRYLIEARDANSSSFATTTVRVTEMTDPTPPPPEPPGECPECPDCPEPECPDCPDCPACPPPVVCPPPGTCPEPEPASELLCVGDGTTSVTCTESHTEDGHILLRCSCNQAAAPPPGPQARTEYIGRDDAGIVYGTTRLYGEFKRGRLEVPLHDALREENP